MMPSHSTRRAAAILSALLACACGDGAKDSSPPDTSDDLTYGDLTSDDLTYGDLTINDQITWRDRTVVVEGTLTIEGNGLLILERSTLSFQPRVEDTRGLVLRGNGQLIARDSRLESGTGPQWNLEAFDDSRLVLEHTVATSHSGIRAFQRSAIIAVGENVEELQIHDDASITLRDGASAYIVLFFTGDVSTALVDGELGVGEALVREFTVTTGTGTEGRVTLEDAEVYGWQLDLEENASLEIEGGREIVLAMHLTDVKRVVEDDITSNEPRNGTLDFSDDDGPTFTYRDSAVWSFNLYAEGSCELEFHGVVDVTEPNASGSSKVYFGEKTKCWANLAQTYDEAEMTFEGVELLAEDSFPSFTAQDRSSITIEAVEATPDTKLYAVGEGRVFVNGGTGWSQEMVEEIDIEGNGGVFFDPAP